ncbi:MAG: hypothetical protein JJW01_03800 [Alphaproteobacteria bacterium]|nr:hypothetical protein [Rickettsiales bacterium]
MLNTFKIKLLKSLLLRYGKFFNVSFVILSLSFTLALSQPNLVAAAMSSAKLLQKYKKEVNLVNSHLFNSRTVTTSFTQSAMDGTSKGKIYIDKNKKSVIIDYETGSFLLKIFSLNGKNFYLDKDSNETFPMRSQNPVIDALLTESISSGNFLFEKIHTNKNIMEFIFRLAKDPSEGAVRLIFKREPEIKLIFVGVSGSSVEDNVSIDIVNYTVNQKIHSSVFTRPSLKKE